MPLQVLVHEVTEARRVAGRLLLGGGVVTLHDRSQKLLGLGTRVREAHEGIPAERHAAHPTAAVIGHDPPLRAAGGDAKAESGKRHIDVVDLTARGWLHGADSRVD